MTTLQSHAPLIASKGNYVDPWPRYVTACAGAWLFLSALFWTHLAGQRTNALVTGALMFVAAIASIGVSKVRFANSALAVWLLLSTVLLPSYVYTEWNNVIVAIVVFVFSLVPSGHNGLFSRPI